MHWLQVIITPIAALVLSGALYLYGRHRGRVSERLLVEQFICDLYTWPERPEARMLRYEGDQRRQRLRGAGAQKEGAKRRARIRFQNRSCVVTLQGAADERCVSHQHQEYGTLTPDPAEQETTTTEQGFFVAGIGDEDHIRIHIDKDASVESVMCTISAELKKRGRLWPPGKVKVEWEGGIAAPHSDESESEWVLRHFLADLGISAEDLVTEIELERDAHDPEDFERMIEAEMKRRGFRYKDQGH